MDQKTWLWRRRSSEKTIVTNEDEFVPFEKEVELENSLKTLNEKMASVLDEYKKKAEDETLRLRQELDEAHERLLDLNTALKETMEQLKLVREEQEQKIHVAVIEASREFEKSHNKLTVECSYLSKALFVKEKLIEDLNNSKFQTESEFEALMSRLDSIEKENVFLRYEYRTLEKEFELKSEEMEYSRRSVEASRKQHLENVKKMKKLEGECQRLRGKRVPGPGPNNANKKVSFLIDQVCDLEKENRLLKECLAKKEEEMEIVLREKEEKLDLVVSDLVSDECKTFGASDMSLMDDFVEMEKLAIVAVDEFKTNDPYLERDRGWIEEVRNLILEEHNVSKRSLDELLGDVRARLDDIICPEAYKLQPISGYIAWKSPTSSPRSFLEKSIKKILELVDRFDLQCEQSSNYKIRVFRWENGETNAVLQEFVRSCNCLMEGKINFEKFIEDLASFLDWIINNCVSNQDHSTVRDEFEKHLGGAGPGTAFELESVQKLMFEMEKIYSISQVEIEGLKNELEILKRTNEDQIENMKLINEDLDTQLNVTKSKLNDVLQKLSSVEVELDDKSHCCEELEGTCLDLQLQLQSVTSNRYSGDDENQEELLRTGSEITKASLKLSQCEETILKLGNQLKALGSAKELSVVDKVLSITDTNNKKSKQQHLSLHDQMLSEDKTEVKNYTKAIISTTELKNDKYGPLAIVPSKRKGVGFGFLRKLLIRRKKTSSKNTLLW
ncbi:hypothetical protein BUALT_Bualt15G0042500 [Buddleja alternifolia]|uniref:Filament-like plant protein 7 n=1 Tax=Buddleja alternifolia TaxID=168488 RepID=A0AAV6WE90_9LAMI|nr:hypothetical protein BUALT_Bualt15G0042500 [Buddleja alternifolia]